MDSRPRKTTLETFNEELAILDRPLEDDVEYIDERPPRRRAWQGMSAVIISTALLPARAVLFFSHPDPDAIIAAAQAAAATAPAAPLPPPRRRERRRSPPPRSRRRRPRLTRIEPAGEPAEVASASAPHGVDEATPPLAFAAATVTAREVSSSYGASRAGHRVRDKVTGDRFRG